jgi:hypothetical protein
LFTVAFGCVLKRWNASAPVEVAHHANADFIPNFGVPCVPGAGLHGHGLSVIVCLGELWTRVGVHTGVPSVLKLLLVQGAYPTLIVILVCVRKSPVDHYVATYTTGIQFAHASSLGSKRPDHVMSQLVYAVRREDANDTDTRVSSAMFAGALDDEKV